MQSVPLDRKLPVPLAMLTFIFQLPDLRRHSFFQIKGQNDTSDCGGVMQWYLSEDIFQFDVFSLYNLI